MVVDGWGMLMRVSGDMEWVKRDGMRKVWFDFGFFIVWMGIVVGVVVKVLVIYWGLVWYEKMVCIMVSMGVVMWGGWRVMIGFFG